MVNNHKPIASDQERNLIFKKGRRARKPKNSIRLVRLKASVEKCLNNPFFAKSIDDPKQRTKIKSEILAAIPKGVYLPIEDIGVRDARAFYTFLDDVKHILFFTDGKNSGLPNSILSLKNIKKKKSDHLLNKFWKSIGGIGDYGPLLIEPLWDRWIKFISLTLRKRPSN